jgi:hypothetical protein
MSALNYLIAFGVAPLFFLAAAAKLATALRLPEQKGKLMRQVVLYSLAGLAWLLAAFVVHT